jgi:hypothetical protein
MSIKVNLFKINLLKAIISLPILAFVNVAKVSAQTPTTRPVTPPASRPTPSIIRPAPAPVTQPAPTRSDFNETRPNALNRSVFSIQGGERLVAEAMTAIGQQNYDVAVTKLQDARQVYNQLSNFYQDLTSSFSGIDNRISDRHRQKALQTAQLRDVATYQLAIAYRGKNQPELAIPLLVQLIRSQQPTRELGQQAYQQLYELGFVEDSFPRAANNPPNIPTNTPSAPPK